MNRRLLSLPLASVGAATALALIVVSAFSPSSESVRSVAAYPHGRRSELAVIFLASATCRGINDNELPAAVRGVIEELRARTGIRVHSIGISVDEAPQVGHRLLAKFGPFDEEHTGGGYLNSAAHRYLVEHPGLRALPQIIIVERDVVQRGGIIYEADSRVLLRRVGPRDIITLASTLPMATATE